MEFKPEKENKNSEKENEKAMRSMAPPRTKTSAGRARSQTRAAGREWDACNWGQGQGLCPLQVQCNVHNRERHGELETRPWKENNQERRACTTGRTIFLDTEIIENYDSCET